MASGLLNEQPIPNKASNIVSSPNSMAPMEQFKAVQSDVNGVLLTGAAAFIIVWLIDWARRGRNDGYQTGRVSVVTTAFTAIALVTYAYVRRQWLKYLRRQAVDAASALVTNLQAFHASMTSSLSFIQEVELISRGYRLYVRFLIFVVKFLTPALGAVHCRQFHDSKKRARTDGAQDFVKFLNLPTKRLFRYSQISVSS